MFRSVPILPLLYGARSLWDYHHRSLGFPVLQASGTADDFCEIPLEQRQKRGPHTHHRARFREMRILEYENRLRLYSSPEKVFRYFATIKMKHKSGRWEVYMTPPDFMRAITPGSRRQPESLGLDKFYKVSEGHMHKHRCSSLSDNSIFYSFQKDGLLSFGDYLFLVMLLSVPERYFELAFRLFDVNGDGNLSHDDMNLYLSKVCQGDGSVRNMNVNHYFFGPNLDQKLNVNVFLEFQRKLASEVLLLEFQALLKNSKTVLSEVAFTKMLMAYSTANSMERATMLHRVQEKYKNSDKGVTLDEFLTFFRFLKDVAAVDSALTFHYLSGADISRQTLRHIAHVVVGVHLTDHIIDIIFTIFDTDDNGILSRTDFFETLRDRFARTPRRKYPHLAALMGIACRCATQVFVDRYLH
ncbi:calcium uptake protein 1 homolog, mitochondrial [Drosophila miranda]|uniref:calcium uptake protein 1 homolog, mitochondrial n=1 Tax=Drosophila miranda TaxID=7229 RepID=UPI0007E689CC|nr:calcium uptake protein 1 homolog, mitochondrial [Drosophila miranda]